MSKKIFTFDQKMKSTRPTTDAERNEEARAKWLNPATQVNDRFSDRFPPNNALRSSPLQEAPKASVARSLPRTLASSTYDVGSTRWLKLQTQVYLDKSGCDKKWDRVVRTTKLADDVSDAVAIMAMVRVGGEEKILAVKQFRPPINAFTVELPAGLIDEGETAGQAAQRELLEETNYEGFVTSVGPAVFLSPGLTNESVRVVRMQIEGEGGGVKEESEVRTGGECLQGSSCYLFSYPF